MRKDARRAPKQSGGRRSASTKRLLWISLGLGWLAIVAAVLISTISQPRGQGSQAASSDGQTSQAASSGVIGTRVGNTAPDFRLVDINKVTVTRSSLVSGKPGLMFFTATWCLPCIEGLKHLERFQRDVGGSPFTVLVLFVDPQETDNDLRAYQVRFKFPSTWHYALDRDNMVVKYSLRYLDTKYVLDQNGVIRFTDFYPAEYNTWVRALATVGISR